MNLRRKKRKKYLQVHTTYLIIFFPLQAKVFPEIHVQLKAFCGIKSKDIYLRHIHKLITAIIKDHNDHHYKSHAFKTSKDKHVLDQKFEDPYLELFLWSILTGKSNLTDFFWKRTHCPLVATIIGASIYSNLIQFYKGNSAGWAWTDTSFLEKAKQKWQDKANDVSFL